MKPLWHRWGVAVVNPQQTVMVFNNQQLGQPVGKLDSVF